MIMTAKELATLTGLNVRSIYRMAREGRVDHIRVGGRIFFRIEESYGKRFKETEVASATGNDGAD